MFGTLEKKLRPILFYGNNPTEFDRGCADDLCGLCA